MELDDEAAKVAYELRIRELEDEQEAAQIKTDLRIRELEDEQKNTELRFEMRQRELEDQQQKAQDAYDNKIRLMEEEHAALDAADQTKLDDLQSHVDQEGVILSEARKKLITENEATMSDLVAWNKLYGDGLNDTILTSWQTATDAMNAYADAYLYTIMSLPPPPEIGTWNDPNRGRGQGDGNGRIDDPTNPDWWAPNHHSGIESGNASGIKNNEVLSLLTKDEIIFKPNQLDNLIKNLVKFPSMPEFSSNASQGNITIEMPINVAGNLDKSVMPDLNNLVDSVVRKINDNMRSRGFVRSTGLTSI